MKCYLFAGTRHQSWWRNWQGRVCQVDQADYCRHILRCQSGADRHIGCSTNNCNGNKESYWGCTPCWEGGATGTNFSLCIPCDSSCCVDSACPSAVLNPLYYIPKPFWEDCMRPSGWRVCLVSRIAGADRYINGDRWYNYAGIMVLVFCSLVWNM